MSYHQQNSAPGTNEVMGGNALILVVFFVATLVGAWWLLKDHILYYSLFASFHIFQWYETLDSFIPFMTKAELGRVKGAYMAIPDMDHTKETFKTFTTIAGIHGYFQRWIAIPIFAWFFWKAPKWGVRFKYRRSINNIYDLIDVQAKTFVASAMVKGIYILREHPHMGPFATYDLPVDFALDRQLLWAADSEVEPGNTVDEKTMVPIPALTPDEKLTSAEFSVDVKDRSMAFRRQRMPHYNYVLLNHRRAHDMFVEQLGKPWTGWQGLPNKFQQALYAVLCLQLNGKVGAAQKLIDQIGMSFKPYEYDKKTGKMTKEGSIDTTGIEAILAEEANSQAARAVANRHYHANSVLIRTLEMARKRGRLMHSNLLWLKWTHPENRTLWYGLCGNGSQCPYWEAAGVEAHMQFEDLAKGALSTPHVGSAVLALEDMMMREHWVHPGEYGEEAQQRQVREANREFRMQEEQERIAQERKQTQQQSPYASQAQRRAQQARAAAAKKGEDEP